MLHAPACEANSSTDIITPVANMVTVADKKLCGCFVLLEFPEDVLQNADTAESCCQLSDDEAGSLPAASTSCNYCPIGRLEPLLVPTLGVVAPAPSPCLLLLPPSHLLEVPST